MKIKAKNGKDYYLVDVTAQILKYLKVELINNHLQRGGHSLEATDFDWVITVPAIWRARGKQMMREAGYKVTRGGTKFDVRNQWSNQNFEVNWPYEHCTRFC